MAAAAVRGLPCAWPLVPAQPRPAVCPGPVSSRRAQLRSPPPRPVAGRAPSVPLCLPSSVPGASAVLCRRPSETRPRRALRHPGGAARLRCLVRAPAPVRPGSCLRVALPSGARTPSGFRVLLPGPSPVTSSWALSPAPACRPAGRPAAPRPRRSLLRASPPARPVSLERAVSSSPRAKRLASDGGSGGRLGSALLTLHSMRGTDVERSNKTLFTGTGRARFRPQASFLAPAVLPTAPVVTSACRCDFRHSVCSLKSPARIPWRSV